MSAIYEFLKGHPEFQVILEVGAAHGDSTPAIMQCVGWKGGHYFAFEPDPRLINKFPESAAFNAPGFKLVPAAVGSQTGDQTFHASDGEDAVSHEHRIFSGSLKKPVEHLTRCPWVKFEREIKVRVVDLDHFLWPYGLEKIDFIWCDAQGAEDQIITGAQETLRKTRFFYTEYYDYQMYENQIGWEEIQRRLPGRWRVIDRWDTDVLFENTGQ